MVPYGGSPSPWATGGPVGAIVYTGDRLECLDEAVGIWAMPVHRLLA